MIPQRIVGLALIVLLVVSVIGMLGCIEKEEETVKVGALYPLTGSLANTGAEVKNGVLFAEDIINNEYDLDIPLARSKGIESLNGAEVEIVFGDTQGSPSIGKAEAERLINEEKVVALIGCSKSAVAAEVSKVAEDKGVPYIATDATASSLTQQPHTWFFRTTPHDAIFVQNFYEFLQDIQEEEGITVEKLGIVHEDSIWGSETGEYEVQYAREYGYSVVERIAYSADATDVTSEVQRLKDAEPDVVMQTSYVNDAILYMQTYKDLNFNPDAILANSGGFINPTFLQVLGDGGNYILTREVWSKDLAATKPLVGTINQLFRERYGRDMNGNSARAFTGVLVLADAIDRAGSTDPEEIRKALLETNISSDQLIMPWDGVKFDQETHQNTLGRGIIAQIIDQEYYTVWPRNLATKEVIWPTPPWDERDESKVAIIFDTSGLDDAFNNLFFSGVQKAEAELGITLDYVIAEAVTEFEGLQRGYAESGDYDLIICAGENQAGALLNVSADFPEQKFVLIDGTMAERQNVASFLFRDEESSFLAGALTAMVTTTDKIGFVGGMDIPVINRFLAGYQAGAHYINPDCEIVVSYVGSWANQGRGKELTLAHYDAGADIVFGAAGLSGEGVIDAAQERGLYAIGADTDQRYLAPENVLVSAVKSIDVVIFAIIKETVEGEFKGGVRSLGLKEDGVGLSLDNALPVVTDEMKDEVNELREKILSGEIEVPTGDLESPIKIGAIYNLEGSQASLDIPSANGAKLAVREINNRGGINGRELQLLLCDGKTDPGTIEECTHQLVETETVSAIIGFSDTDMVLAAAPIAAGAQTVFITSGATSPKLPEKVPEYLFLACFGDNVQAAAGAEYAYDHIGLKTAYLLVDEEMEYTRLLGDYFKERYTELGGTIILEDTYKGGTTDFSGQIAALEELDRRPDMLYIASGPDDIGTIIKQFREAGVDQPIFGGDGYDTPELTRIAGDHATDVYFTTHALIDEANGTDRIKEFIAAYKEEYGIVPENAFAALGYDTIMLLADAIERAGSDDPQAQQAILTALQDTKDLEGTTGTISYESGSRIPRKGVTIVSIVNGIFTYSETVVPERVPSP